MIYFFMPRLRHYKLVHIDLPSDESVGERMARLRKGHGLTQRELAAKIGVSRSVIMDYERGKNHVYVGYYQDRFGPWRDYR